MEKEAKIVITTIKESDLQDLATLQLELIDEEANLDRMKELLSTILKDSNYHLLCAKRGGRVIGSLVGIVCHDLFGKCIPFMVVENMIVTKDQQGQGVGTMLMAEIERIAESKGCRYMTLVSSAKRADAHKFYHRCGYESEPYIGFKKMIQGK